MPDYLVTYLVTHRKENMNDPAFKTAAYAIAEAAPRHLDQPTTPPIHWRVEGDILRVLLADGRTVRAPIEEAQRNAKTPSVKKQTIVPGSSTGAEAPMASLPLKVVVPVPERKPLTPSPKGKKK